MAIGRKNTRGKRGKIHLTNFAAKSRFAFFVIAHKY